MKILKRQNSTPFPFLSLPTLFSLAILSLLPLLGCQGLIKSGSGTVGLLYTSEVGGRLDPCG